MATTLDVINSTPSSVLFRITADADAPVYFWRAGATGADKDLTSLVAGPLREFLYRLPPFGWQVQPDIIGGVNGRVLRWDRTYLDGAYYETPVEADVIGVGPSVIGRSLDVKIGGTEGPSGQGFSFTPGSNAHATLAIIGLRYIRSQNR
jgi:hypothetical protein